MLPHIEGLQGVEQPFAIQQGPNPPVGGLILCWGVQGELFRDFYETDPKVSLLASPKRVHSEVTHLDWEAMARVLPIEPTDKYSQYL